MNHWYNQAESSNMIQFVRLGLLLCLASTLLTCTQPRTEIIVVVDTDLDVPGEIGFVLVEVTNPDGETKEASDTFSSKSELPATVGVLYSDGPLGPITVRVLGRGGDSNQDDVIERRARVFFVAEQTLTLFMPLLRSCVGVSCNDEMTCADGDCRQITVGPDELLAWTGTPPSIDASAGDADADVDGDGDGDGDSDVDADTDSDGDVDADADSDFDTDPDPDITCVGDEVPWEGVCEARLDLTSCPHDCVHPSCNDFNEVACIEISAGFRCVGRIVDQPWEGCSSGW